MYFTWTQDNKIVWFNLDPREADLVHRVMQKQSVDDLKRYGFSASEIERFYNLMREFD